MMSLNSFFEKIGRINSAILLFTCLLICGMLFDLAVTGFIVAKHEQAIVEIKSAGDYLMPDTEDRGWLTYKDFKIDTGDRTGNSNLIYPVLGVCKIRVDSGVFGSHYDVFSESGIFKENLCAIILERVVFLPLLFENILGFEHIYLRGIPMFGIFMLALFVVSSFLIKIGKSSTALKAIKGASLGMILFIIIIFINATLDIHINIL